MNAGFDENEAEFRVLVLAVALEVLADGDGLIDTHQLLPIPLSHETEERLRVCVCKGEWMGTMKS